MADGFWLIFKRETGVLKKRSSFTINSLTETFCRAVYLRTIRLRGLLLNSLLKEKLLELAYNIFPAVIIPKSLDNPA